MAKNMASKNRYILSYLWYPLWYMQFQSTVPVSLFERILLGERISIRCKIHLPLDTWKCQRHNYFMVMLLLQLLLMFVLLPCSKLKRHTVELKQRYTIEGYITERSHSTARGRECWTANSTARIRSIMWLISLDYSLRCTPVFWVGKCGYEATHISGTAIYVILRCLNPVCWSRRLHG